MKNAKHIVKTVLFCGTLAVFGCQRIQSEGKRLVL